MQQIGVALLSALAWLMTPLAAPAGEPVTIAKLLADPQPYHVRVITLQGTAHQVQILQDKPGGNPRLDFQCYMVHPPYTFVLADDTGFLQISVAARPPCVSQMSPAEPPDVSEGDKVAIEAQITVGHQYSEGADRLTVQALAKGVTKLGN
ncbi:MAG: hypothetical protein ACREIO_05560 [Nitrospiraceae bacterium]